MNLFEYNYLKLGAELTQTLIVWQWALLGTGV